MPFSGPTQILLTPSGYLATGSSRDTVTMTCQELLFFLSSSNSFCPLHGTSPPTLAQTHALFRADKNPLDSAWVPGD